MKIGINARFLAQPYTGIGQYTLHLLEGLSKIDSKNRYVLFTPELADLSLPDNFEQVRVQDPSLHSASLEKAHWEHTLLPREMQNRGIELAHFPYPSNPWRTLPFPVIVTVHDVIPWVLPEYQERLRSKVYHFYSKMALRKADHWITVSEFSKKEIHRLFKKIPAKDITVIENSAPDLPHVEAPALELRHPYFLYVGGYDHRKNVPLLIQTYQQYIAPHHAIDLILVGGKNHGLEAYLTHEHSLKITDDIRMKDRGRVVFTDPLETEHLYFLYQKALSFIHLSSYEGFNIPLLEAMYFGIPAIVSDIPPHHEVAQDAARFVPHDDPAAIGQVMETMIGDEALRKNLAGQGQKRAQGFTQKKHAEKTLDVYNLFS